MRDEYLVTFQSHPVSIIQGFQFPIYYLIESSIGCHADLFLEVADDPAPPVNSFIDRVHFDRHIRPGLRVFGSYSCSSFVLCIHVVLVVAVYRRGIPLDIASVERYSTSSTS